MTEFQDNQNDNPRTGIVFLLEIVIRLARRKRLILSFTLAVALCGVGLVLLIPNKYVGTTRVLIPQQGQSTAAAMLSQLGGSGLASMAGGALGIKNQTDMYIAMVKSRSVSDAIIARFKLKEKFSSKTMVAARKKLATRVQVGGGKDGIITIDYEDKNAEFAALVANAYVEELDALMRRLAVTEAGRRRSYYERLLSQARGRLTEAEQAYRAIQEKSGLIQPDAQAKATIETIAKLRAEVTAREVKIGSMATFSTESNPEMIRAKREIEELNAQLQSLENSGEPRRRGDIVIPTGQVPELAMEVIRRTRDLKYQETLYELLAKQYELARFDEAKDSASIQIIDRAIPMDYKSGPPRSLIVLVLTLLAFALSSAYVLISERLRERGVSPDTAEKLEQLKLALGRGA